MTHVCLKTTKPANSIDEHSKENKKEEAVIRNCLATPGEDSSYDSDYDAIEEQTHGHNDVSRTVSDTLGQEFSEYVTTTTNKSQEDQQQIDSVYQSRLEFALKLGYTEKLVQVAIQKLGQMPEENELLAELIKLGTHQLSCSKLKNNFDICDNVKEFAGQGIVNSDRNKQRPIVIDGSNVAMSHGNKEVFSCRGIKICVDWFRTNGHTEITVFVPKWRKESPRPDNPVIDQEILYELEKERLLVFTPSREVGGKRMVCYDDRYILKLAADNDGIVVSNDNYRDLIQECPEFRKVVEERILMYSFVNDRFMPPDDPLGRSGPTLDNFLRMPTHCKGGICPYGRKCTYGNKCKYNHPERGTGPQKSVTERLAENVQKQLLARSFGSIAAKKVRGKSLSLPLQSSSSAEGRPLSQTLPRSKQPLSRTKSTASDQDRPHRTHLTGYVSTSACPMTTANSVHLPSSATTTTSPYYCRLYQLNHVPLGQALSFPIRTADVNVSAENLHRKLHRQLSINPTCDARIQRTRTHLPASRRTSYQERDSFGTSHSNVTRICSAPPSNPPSTVTSECTRAGTSSTADQFIASARSCAKLPAAYKPLRSGHTGSPAFVNHISICGNVVEESRYKLRYHLACIFPTEQVDAAFRYYPNETNPQKICGAILSMFPK